MRDRNIRDEDGGDQNQCASLPHRTFAFNQLDRSIEAEKTSINYLKAELESRERALKELEKVRKLVTPETEAAVRALAKVGLV